MREPTPDAALTPAPKNRAKQALITLFKIVIAVAGITWVVWNMTWYDKATIPAGAELFGIKFVHDTPVIVLDRHPLPPPFHLHTQPATIPRELLRIRFPDKPVDLIVEGKPVSIIIAEHTLVPGLGKELGIQHEGKELNLEQFKPVEGRPTPIEDGLRTPLVAGSHRWYLLAAAWLLLLIPFFISAYRWRALMQPQGIRLPFGKCLQLTFVGQFYSIVLPGITGGDLVKIVYTARLTGSKTKSFITIILDRVIGLLALMAIAGASAGVQLLFAPKLDNTLLNVFLMIAGLLLLFAAGATVYFSHRLRRLVGIEWFVEHFGAADDFAVRHQKIEHLFRVLNVLLLTAAALAIVVLALLRWQFTLPWAQHNHVLILILLAAAALAALFAAAGLLLHEKLSNRMAPLIKKGVETLVHVDETLHVYRGHSALLVWAFLISLVSQLTLPLSAWLSGLAFGMHVNIGYFLAYVPIAVLASSLPISPPQGFGVMDFILLHFFHDRAGAPEAGVFALTQAIRFLPILWNLVGAYWVVRGRFTRHTVPEGIEIQDPPDAPPPQTS